MIKKNDVVIVGAGLAGLTAAREIVAAHYDVMVLEARARVGGRTLGYELSEGNVIDLGGQWINPEQSHIQKLIEEFGLETVLEDDDGKVQLVVEGNIFEHDESPFQALPRESASELLEVLDRIEILCEQISLNEPYNAPNADKWDSMTVESWKQRAIKTKHAQSAFDTFVRAQLAAEPADLSFLSFLYDIHSAGGLDQITEVGGTAPEYRIVGGSQQLSQLLAEEFDDSIHLEAPVRAINQRKTRVSIVSDVGKFNSSYAIVAVPPAIASRIAYDPPLPARRDALNQRIPMGSTIKCIVTYEEPFWRDDGYSGMVLDNDGVIGLVFDITPPESSTGALVGFILASQARTWSERASDERRKRVLADFTRYFGSQAAEPTEYIEQLWTNDPWSAGCYAGIMTPGTMTNYGEVLRKPVGRIHWAGTETAARSNGYMDGAIRSGKRAAHEVLARFE